MTLKLGENSGKNGGIYVEVGTRGGVKDNFATIADNKTVQFPSAMRFITLYLMIEQVSCLVGVMARSDLRWKKRVSNYRQDNLPTFFATPLPNILRLMAEYFSFTARAKPHKNNNAICALCIRLSRRCS